MTTHPAPLVDTARSLRSGRRSATDYAEAVCDRLDETEPAIRAFVPEPSGSSRRDRLVEAAAALDARYSDPIDRGPLHGVPVGVKDVFHVDGFATKAGTDLPEEVLAGPEAAVVSRLRAAGALVCGKTQTTEFAYFEPAPTRNPHDTAHTPGGSSSGSAAAVAAGVCPLALGSQNMGSVIRPAAFCGIVGFKPTYERMTLDGALSFAPSVDHAGLFTQDVTSMRLAATLCCRDWLPERRIPTERPTLGVPAREYIDQASSDGIEAFERQLETLEAVGYDVQCVPVPGDADAVNERHETLVAAEAALTHEQYYTAYGDRYAERTAELVETGRAVTTGTLASARAGRGTLRAELTESMDEHELDLWVCPAAPGPAPEGFESTGDPAMNVPWTHAGLPALTVPAGTVGKLPIGLQCVSRPMDDKRLLEWAESIETTLADRP